MSIYRLSDKCAVAGQIRVADIAAIAEAGYRTVICNRPDGEDAGQPAARDVAAECAAHGLTFHFIPVSHGALTMGLVERFQQAVAASDGPVLAYCHSGQRSSVIWQASGAP